MLRLHAFEPERFDGATVKRVGGPAGTKRPFFDQPVQTSVLLKLFRPVFYVCGILGLIICAMMLVVAGFALITGDRETVTFFGSAALGGAVSVLMVAICRPDVRFSLTARQLYLLTSCSWVMMSLIGALPLVIGSLRLDVADAVFESVSGITTTGSTVLVGLERMPRSILLWRSLLQWVGGLGVIAMAVSILPFLQVGGMRLFHSESSDWSEKSLPRLQDMARTLLGCYLMISAACAIAYYVLGMNSFDSINHAMTTVSTGGFATDDRSLGAFGPPVLWAAIVFMLLGSLPFAIYIRLLTRRTVRSLYDQQAYTFLLAVAFASFSLTVYLIRHDHFEWSLAVTQATFHVVSIITTTGYAAGDYTLWGGFSVALFFFLTFVGGCSGSTAGGMKIFRFELSALFLLDQFRRLVHPQGVFVIRYNGEVIRDEILGSAVAFSFLYLAVLAVLTMILSGMDIDFVTSITSAATAIGNVGPGLGPVVGPAGNFSTLPDGAKWLLSFAMLLGRLELLTMMVIFTRAFWRG